MLYVARYGLGRLASRRIKARAIGRCISHSLPLNSHCATHRFASSSPRVASHALAQSTAITRCPSGFQSLRNILSPMLPFASLSTDARDPLPPPPAVALDEEDIVETFVRGSGPGGQKINKTASCVMLRHVPSGIVIRCQESRSQHRNRELARRILRERLDLAIRGEHSRLAMDANRERARKAVKRRKAVKKHFKSRRDRSMAE